MKKTFATFWIDPDHYDFAAHFTKYMDSMINIGRRQIRCKCSGQELTTKQIMAKPQMYVYLTGMDAKCNTCGDYFWIKP